MTYQGVKFNIEFLDREVPHGPRIEELKHWCEVFHGKNLAPPYEGGSYGNLSFRIQEYEEPFVITGSRVGMKHELSDDCFVEVSSTDPNGNIIYARGVREPSSESMLHSAIYIQREDINAIFHGHCEEILLKARKLGLIETGNEEPYGTVELVREVLKILGDKSFLVMKNHGFLSLGRTMEEAGNQAIKIYEKCADGEI